MKKYLTILPLIVLLIVSIACKSASNAGTKVGETGQTPGESTSAANSLAEAEVQTPDAPAKPAATEAPAQPTQPVQQTVFKVGDVIEGDGFRMTLLSAAYTNGVLKTNFLIENTGQKDTSVSSLISFEAKSEDGTKLEQEYMCGSSLDGSILPGDKLKGDMCWKLPAPMKLKIYYKDNVWASGAIVWELDPASLPSALADVAAPALTDPNATNPATVEVFGVGQPVDVNGYQVTLTSAAFAGGVLKANFFIDNTSPEEITISSMMSFDAKDESGTKLEQDYMCGASLDGSVLAGDRLKGDICWKVPAGGKVKLYYTDNVWEGGAKVWELDTATLPAQLAEFPAPSAAPTIPVHQIGEVVAVTGHQITLTGVENANGIVKANFLIENTGNEEIAVSSMMSFFAKNISGVKLDQEYMCGASLDGSVLPGDKLKGDICWKTGGATPIWLYYAPSVFSGGALVWSAQ